MGFKDGFVWGAATASYQVEGAVTEGGRGLTVWDEFARMPGKTFSGHTGDVAADHYHRYAEDVAIMKALGLKAYRFSVAWSRILPQGYGAVNEEGLRFYKNLVDGICHTGFTGAAVGRTLRSQIILQSMRGSWRSIWAIK